jgi:hypothetical protein
MQALPQQNESGHPTIFNTTTANMKPLKILRLIVEHTGRIGNIFKRNVDTIMNRAALIEINLGSTNRTGPVIQHGHIRNWWRILCLTIN